MAAFLREVAGLEGRATFENVECTFPFTRCVRQGSVQTPKEDSTKVCSLMWADNCWIPSHSKEHRELMMKELVEEARRWGLEPKPASLRCTRTYACEELENMAIMTEAGEHKSPFANKFKILGYFFHPEGKMQVQNANKA